MNEQESTYKPLEAGKLLISTSDEDRKELPNGTIFQVHIAEIGLREYDGVEKLSVRFLVDSEGEYQGQSFFKTINISGGPRATITKLALAALDGKLPDGKLDPFDLVGSPLQVIFQPGHFQGKDYQEHSYLPPAKGQKVVTRDVVLTEEDVEKAFADATSA